MLKDFISVICIAMCTMMHHCQSVYLHHRDDVNSVEYEDNDELEREKPALVSSSSNCESVVSSLTPIRYATELCYPGTTTTNDGYSDGLSGGVEIMAHRCSIFVFPERDINGKFTMIELSVEPSLNPWLPIADKEISFYQSSSVLKKYLLEVTKGEATYVNQLKCYAEQFTTEPPNRHTQAVIDRWLPIRVRGRTQNRELINLKSHNENFTLKAILSSSLIWLHVHPHFHETRNNGQSFTSFLYHNLLKMEKSTDGIDFNDEVIEQHVSLNPVVTRGVKRKQDTLQPRRANVHHTLDGGRDGGKKKKNHFSKLSTYDVLGNLDENLAQSLERSDGITNEPITPPDVHHTLERSDGITNEPITPPLGDTDTATAAFDDFIPDFPFNDIDPNHFDSDDSHINEPYQYYKNIAVVLDRIDEEQAADLESQIVKRHALTAGFILHKLKVIYHHYYSKDIEARKVIDTCLDIGTGTPASTSFTSSRRGKTRRSLRADGPCISDHVIIDALKKLRQSEACT